MKKALDPHIKRASQTTIKKIKSNVKKNIQVKNMPTNKKDSTAPPKGNFDDLRDIVSIKKQKAVANELDSMILDQNEEKERRMARKENNETKSRQPSLVDNILSSNPEIVKKMTIKDAIKLDMLTNKSGNINPSALQLFDGNNGNHNEGSLVDKILGILLDKAFTNNNGNNHNNGNSSNDIIKLIMTQNQHNQEMLMKMIEVKNIPTPNNSNNNFMKEMFTMVKSQGDLENSFLREKLRDIEQRVQPTDSLGDAKRMMEYAQSFRGFLGGGNQTPEVLKHEIKLKELEYEQKRQINEEHMRGERIHNITEMINTTVGAFGKALSEPIMEATKAKVEQYTENIKHPEERKKIPKVSHEALRDEIDLGDLESLENELANNEFSEKIRKNRYKVYETSKVNT